MKTLIKPESTSIKRIVFIALPALLLAELGQTTSLFLFFVSVALITLIIYSSTLYKHRVFDYIMVMYMCNLFPAAIGLGGLFLIVSSVVLIIHLFSSGKLIELDNKDRYFKSFIILIFVSSLLGWIFVNRSDLRDLIAGIISFIGIISLLYISGHLIITPVRIIKFIKLNIFLAIYALVASLNTMFKILPEMVALPQWAGDWINEENIFNAGAGGIIGISPLNAQHNLILVLLFLPYFLYLLSENWLGVSKKALLIGIIVTVINVFTAGSKAVFISMLVLVILVYLLLGRLTMLASLGKRITHAVVLVLVSMALLFIVSSLNFDNIFNRFDTLIEINERESGTSFSFRGILDGSSINRKNAFEAASENYKRRNWAVGYGWSTPKYQTDAFYGGSIFQKTRGGSAHSQYFSTLFLFGWLGFIPFWLMHLRCIVKSYGILNHKRIRIEYRIFALALIGMVFALIIHGFTADNSWQLAYFASTLIIIGLGYSNINSAKYFF